MGFCVSVVVGVVLPGLGLCKVCFLGFGVVRVC